MVNKLVYVCVAASAVGLAAIYILATMMEAEPIRIADIDFEMVGMSVKTAGYIAYRTDHKDGHIFLTIEDGDSKIQVPLFSGFVSTYDRENSQLASSRDLRRGALIEVEGLVGEYKGQLQVVPRKADDIKILYD